MLGDNPYGRTTEGLDCSECHDVRRPRGSKLGACGSVPATMSLTPDPTRIVRVEPSADGTRLLATLAVSVLAAAAPAAAVQEAAAQLEQQYQREATKAAAGKLGIAAAATAARGGIRADLREALKRIPFDSPPAPRDTRRG